jgi:hypothetical protein
MAERDVMAEERDWYGETDLSDRIASGGEIVRPTRTREGEPMSTFALRMAEDVLEEVTAIARSRGVPTGTLMRQWIVERLAVEHRRPPSASDDVWGAALEALPRLAQGIADELAGRRSA